MLRFHLAFRDGEIRIALARIIADAQLLSHINPLTPSVLFIGQ